MLSKLGSEQLELGAVVLGAVQLQGNRLDV